MPKFTEMENINYSVKQKLTENAKVENPEQVSKIYNTISDLKAKFSDYESEADEDKEDYATEVDEAFNENPDSIFEQIGLAKEEE